MRTTCLCFRYKINVLFVLGVTWTKSCHFSCVLSLQQKSSEHCDSLPFHTSLSHAVKAGKPNSFPRPFAGWICLCKAHVLWMKWFVFLITASHPFPLCDIQINTLPLAFVLFTLLFHVCWGSLFLSVCAHLSRILLLLLSLLLTPLPLLLLSSCPSSSVLSLVIISRYVACQQVFQCSGQNIAMVVDHRA